MCLLLDLGLSVWARLELVGLYLRLSFDRGRPLLLRFISWVAVVALTKVAPSSRRLP
jgi:hypothetical protein